MREAALTHLQPVLMTSAATVFGHLPLVHGDGTGRSGTQQHRHGARDRDDGRDWCSRCLPVPVFYSLIAAEHQPDTVRGDLEDLVEDDELLVAGAVTLHKGEEFIPC